MRSSSVTAYALGAGILTAAAAPFLLAGTAAPVWSLAGLSAAAVPGIATGALLLREHGRPGPRFVVILGAGIVARLLCGGSVALASAAAGGGATAAALIGLAVGYVVATAFEMVWFARAAPRRGAGSGARA